MRADTIAAIESTCTLLSFTIQPIRSRPVYKILRVNGKYMPAAFRCIDIIPEEHEVYEVNIRNNAKYAVHYDRKIISIGNDR